jgi:hypothetical protein
VQILSYDETPFSGFRGSVGGVKVVVPKAFRQQASRGVSSNREHVTLLSTIGICPDTRQTYSMIPLWVYPNASINSNACSSQFDPHNRTKAHHGVSILSGGVDPSIQFFPPGYESLNLDTSMAISASPCGHVNCEIVLNHFQKHLVPDIRAKGFTIKDRVIIIGDNHVSHLSEDLIRYLVSENIIPYFIYPHSSQDTAALDLVIFGVLKKLGRAAVDAYSQLAQSRNMEMKPHDMPFVMCQPYRQAHSDDNIRKAFAASGIVPFNPSVVIDRSCHSCTHTHAHTLMFFLPLSFFLSLSHTHTHTHTA